MKKSRLVPPSELSAKSLRASDYVTSERDKSRLAKARYFGSEYWCNRDSSSRMEYLGDAAYAFGYKAWHEVPPALKTEILKAFNAGIEDEKAATR